MNFKHVLLKNPRLKGWEYGMLRAFEEEIISQTNAEIVEIPYYGFDPVLPRIGHNMRFAVGRQLLPKKLLKVEADVIWYILMGPENYELDLFKDWVNGARFRIVYLYDTLEPQFPLIQKLFSNGDFNIHITSFDDAVPFLEPLTGRKWHHIEQGIPAKFFQSVPDSERVIQFSSYGRRYPDFHQALIEFSECNGLYYDFTTHDGKHPVAPELTLYRQYAWHLSHSMFTVSWPVEFTNPERAGRLRPVTCRWFEAAASGTVLLGRKPENKLFDKLLHPGLVVEIDPFAEKSQLMKKLEDIFHKRKHLLEESRKIQEANRERWTWTNRVERILDMIK